MRLHPSLFPTGRLLATSGVAASIPQAEIEAALLRHVSGDWGDLCADDKAANELAVLEGSRLLSAYASSEGETFWIITEWDRSATTVLFPSEY